MRACQSSSTVKSRYAHLTLGGKFTGEVRFQTKDLAKPLQVRKWTRWSVWNDLFHDGVTDDQIASAISVMARRSPWMSAAFAGRG